MYIDVAHAAVWNTFDRLNVVAPRLDTLGMVIMIPIRNVATSPLYKRVILLIEFLAESPHIYIWPNRNSLDGAL